MEFEGVNCNEL